MNGDLVLERARQVVSSRAKAVAAACFHDDGQPGRREERASVSAEPPKTWQIEPEDSHYGVVVQSVGMPGQKRDESACIGVLVQACGALGGKEVAWMQMQGGGELSHEVVKWVRFRARARQCRRAGPRGAVRAVCASGQRRVAGDAEVRWQRRSPSGRKWSKLEVLGGKPRSSGLASPRERSISRPMR